MLMWVLLFLLLFILLWLILMLAVIQFVVVSSAVNARVFIPLIALIGSVPLCLAVLAIGFWLLVCLIVTHLHILKL